MKPLDKAYWQELSRAELAAVVRARYAQITASDPHRDERAQLRDSGVLESTIASLYPFDFAELAAGLKPLLTKEALGSQSLGRDLSYTVDETNRISATLRKHVLLIDPEVASPSLEAAVGDLASYVRALVQPSQADSDRALVVVLWYALGFTYLTQQLPAEVFYGGLTQRIFEHFCRTTDVLLPQLLLCEQVERQLSQMQGAR